MADRKSTLKMEERRDAPAKGRSFFLAAKVAVRARVAQGGLTARCPRKNHPRSAAVFFHVKPCRTVRRDGCTMQQDTRRCSTSHGGSTTTIRAKDSPTGFSRKHSGKTSDNTSTESGRRISTATFGTCWRISVAKAQTAKSSATCCFGRCRCTKRTGKGPCGKTMKP